ncbi:terminase small subunit [Pasteurellaceae bacterium TAE3-ERU1]|nr:terminase small subunit [Pasteurellaceae bacterium TAE3-ERU1]
MTLTQKQVNFCNAYLETGNASEAYRQAYNAENMKAETINRKASELMSNGKVKARIEEMREKAAQGAQVTLESHLERLAELSLAAQENGQYSAAINAEIARGKAAGLYTEKAKIDLNAQQLPTVINVVFDDEPDEQTH